jgi:hypothetical protein
MVTGLSTTGTPKYGPQGPKQEISQPPLGGLAHSSRGVAVNKRSHHGLATVKPGARGAHPTRDVAARVGRPGPIREGCRPQNLLGKARGSINCAEPNKTLITFVRSICRSTSDSAVVVVIFDLYFMFSMHDDRLY